MVDYGLEGFQQAKFHRLSLIVISDYGYSIYRIDRFRQAPYS